VPVGGEEEFQSQRGWQGMINNHVELLFAIKWLFVTNCEKKNNGRLMDKSFLATLVDQMISKTYVQIF
jgi:hypothetical protein